MATEAHPKRHLTKKQMDFIEEYLNCFNAVEAYIKAGYSTNGKTATINKNAYTLLNSESIQNELKEQLENIKDEKDHLLVKLEKFYAKQIDNPDIAMKDRLKAAELLSKTLGAFQNDVKLEADDLNFTFNIIEPDEEW